MRPEDADEPPIEGVSGLGETYRSRLKEEGIGTLPALAESDPATVADAAGVTDKKAREWVDRANELVTA
jgi:predicted flap endonuclease-1-like 5' DNA nuclease